VVERHQSRLQEGWVRRSADTYNGQALDLQRRQDPWTVSTIAPMTASLTPGVYSHPPGSFDQSQPSGMPFTVPWGESIDLSQKDWS
jgi:hypothetical protein